MQDRVPLAQPSEKTEDKPVEDKAKKTTNEEATIDEMKDMRALSILFENDSLGGRDIDRIYEWAKSETGKPGGPDVVLAVKKLIRKLGYMSKGKSLVQKVAQWIYFQNSITDMKKRQEAL